MRRPIEMLLYPVGVAAVLLACLGDLLPTQFLNPQSDWLGWLSLSLNRGWALENHAEPCLAALFLIAVPSTCR